MIAVFVTLPAGATLADVEAQRPRLEAALRGTRYKGTVEVGGRVVATLKNGKWSVKRGALR